MSNEETAPYGSGAAAQAAPRKRIRTHHLREMKERGEKITMLTAYDMFTAATFDEAGIDLLLGIGGTPEGIITACAMKSMGGVIQGRLWPTDDEERQRAVDVAVQPQRLAEKHQHLRVARLRLDLRPKGSDRGR